MSLLTSNVAFCDSMIRYREHQLNMQSSMVFAPAAFPQQAKEKENNFGLSEFMNWLDVTIYSG